MTTNRFSFRVLSRLATVFAVVALFIAPIFIISADPVLAQTNQDVFGVQSVDNSALVLSRQDIRVTILNIISIFLGLLGLIAVSIVLYAGFLYMTSGGSEEKVSQARKMLINAGIGLAIIMSAFAITRFVINSLSDAAGIGGGSVPTVCSDPVYASQFPERCFIDNEGNLPGGSACTLNPTLCCAQRNFVVQSITPRTDATGMNNVVIRAVFSRGLRTPARDVLRIERGDTDITNQFTFRFSDRSNQIVEGRYTGSSACSGTTGCLPSGTYRVAVAQDVVRDRNGRELQTTVSCGTFPTSTVFTVNVPGTVDSVAPTVRPMTIDGTVQVDRPLAVGERYTIAVPAIDNSGVSYTHLTLREEGRSEESLTYQGPTIERGSDATNANPFSLEYQLVLARNTRPNQRYIITATTVDIDGNSTIASSTFITIGTHCANGIQDGDEEGVDIGGSCLSVGTCTENYQCVSGQCVSGQCAATPIIISVDPWNGGTGNWVTIEGRFFGQTPGQVEFGRDADDNGTIDAAEWTQAALVSCGNTVSWSDTWAIVSVPSDTVMPTGTQNHIRLSRVGDAGAFDTTNNNRGVRRAFEKNSLVRPQLCRVETVQGSLTEATPGTSVRAVGQNFGTTTGAISFGNVTGVSSAWEPTQVLSSVPERMRPGVVRSVVRVNTVQSNSVPFTILPVPNTTNTSTDPTTTTPGTTPADRANPRIISVDPLTITPGSYMTVRGVGFGGSIGTVYLTDTNTRTCQPGNLDGCTRLETTLPADCGVTWNSEQIIVRVPLATAARGYGIVIRTSNGRFARFTASQITVQRGEPLPSLCRITPSRGPAPLGDALPGQQPPRLILTGTNFSPGASAYFWTAGANPAEVSTWLSARAPELIVDSATRIRTPIPVRANGVSMQTGPIRVQVGTVLSNSLTYTVDDCRVSGAPAGMECCANGTVVSQGLACPGETRDAGYVWRFTTGRLVRAPRVVESCEEASPSPWQGHDAGTQSSCTNADIRVQFTLPMDPASLRTNTRIYTCGNGATPVCTGASRQDVTPEFTILDEGPQGLVARPSNGGGLDQNTWYHIELLTGIQSQEWRMVLGANELLHEALRIDRPCGDGTAYCFDFRTNSSICALVSARITPSFHTTPDLGIVQDPRYPLSFADPLNEALIRPLYYFIWGRADQACTSMNVDGLGWRWSTGNTNVATALVRPQTRPLYRDTRAMVTALAVTPGVEIRATTNTATGIVVGTSTLVVDLGTPRVTEFWPNCTESCANAGIGVMFNQSVLVSTLPGGIEVYTCRDPLCLATDPRPLSVVPVFESGVTSLVTRIYQVQPTEALAPNTWYLVRVTNQIRGATALTTSTPGVPLTPFSWRFRTKATDSLCIAASVRVEPNPAYANEVGAQLAFQAIPLSAPNQCSVRGQDLNPWAYGWDWDTAEPDVATITNFQSVAYPRPECTARCTPRGATFARGQNTNAICGNGIVETAAGEDCDVAAAGEVFGVSCSATCLRPGNPNQGATGALRCGNGVVDIAAGEECDPGVNGETLGTSCSVTCLRPGNPGGLGTTVGQCGNGVLETTEGEECDSGSTQTDSCTNECVRSGTRFLSRAWCASTRTILAGGGVRLLTPLCQTAVSVCGNNQVEVGEQCEIVGANTFGPGQIRLGERTVVTVSDVSVCTNRCVLANICNETTLPVSVRCTAGTEGCNTDCTLAGSSMSYTFPSLCGDTVSGIGEVAACEYAPNEVSAASVLGQNPIQMLRAVGRGQADPGTDLQSTEVQARPTRTRDITTLRVDPGVAQFYLQCGFREYPETERLTAGVANNCPQNASGGNEYGVGTNSCCSLRSTRTEEYPVDGAGLVGNTEPVCRNTAIRATFNREISAASVAGNVRLARGYERNAPCIGTPNDITVRVSDTLALNSSVGATWWERLWHSTTRFFRSLLGERVAASDQSLPQIQTWCATTVPVQSRVSYTRNATTNAVESSNISVQVSDQLDPNAVYAVLLETGESGITDVNGVGILPDQNNPYYDSWVFRTGDERCVIDRITLSEEQITFTTPNTQVPIEATVVTTNGGEIVPIPGVYNWVWSWGPTNHSVFTIPSSTQATNTIASRNIEGEAFGFVELNVTEDTSTSNNQLGRRFTDIVPLSANFCEQPWPIREAYPYEDGNPLGRTVNNDGYVGDTFDPTQAMPPVRVANNRSIYFNYSMGYCSDSGRGNDTSDDLPFLRPLIVGYTNGRDLLPQADALKKTFFFNDRNDDVIGVQIFDNTPQAITVTTPPPARPADPAPVTPNRQTFEFVSHPLGSNSTWQAGTWQTIRWTGGSAGDRVTINFSTPPSPTQPSGGSVNIVSNEINDGSFVWFVPEDFTPGSYQLYMECCRQLSLPGPGNFAHGGTIQITPSQNTTQTVGPVQRSIREWYRSRFGASPPSQFRNVSIDGYEALSDGNNYYVSVLNQENERSRNGLTNYIFQMSVNADADAQTKAVFEQLVGSLEFNINIPDIGYCSRGDGQSVTDLFEPDTQANLACTTDFDCVSIARDRVCANARTKLMRDVTRLEHIRTAQRGLDEFHTRTGVFPNLSAGTFLPTYTNSRWPSWGSTLASILGVPLGLDPVNNWTGCDGADPQTCWNEAQQAFICPARASIYEYTTDQTGSVYQLHVPFEYFRDTTGVVGDYLDESHIRFDRTCRDTSITPGTGTCGNGRVDRGSGEQCDPPLRATPRTDCPAGLVGSIRCTATCQLETDPCRVGGQCGNGVLESGELCDDGARNGQYGRCIAQTGSQNDCRARSPQYCGNGVRDFVDTNNNRTRDANEAWLEACDTAGLTEGYCRKDSCDVPRAIFTAQTVAAAVGGARVIEDMSFVPRSATQGWAVTNRDLYRLQNNSWVIVPFQRTGLGFPPANTQITDVFFAEESHGWVISLTGNLWRTIDTGASWVTSNITLPPNSQVRDMYFMNRDQGVIGLSTGQILRTENGGETWQAAQINTTQSIYDFSFSSADIGYAASDNGTIFKTLNGGRNWATLTRIVPTNQRFRTVYAVSDLVVYAAGDNIVRSTDGGQTWTTQIQNPIGTRAVTDISFFDDRNGVAVGQNRILRDLNQIGGGVQVISNPLVFLTTDGGTTWTFQSVPRVVGGATVNAYAVSGVMLSPERSLVTVGGSIWTITPDPYCSTNTACTGTNGAASTCSYGDSCIMDTIPSYHPIRGLSCAPGCQLIGRYCGDGITDAATEECDDGNQINTDSCSNLCRAPATAPVAPNVQEAAYCGDGVVQTQSGEECDAADQNGVRCEPGYNTQCTFCSVQCRIETRDPVARCGDGILQPQNEACDTVITALGEQVTNTTTPNVYLTCPAGDIPQAARGIVRCVNSCQNIERTCTVCGLIETCTCPASTDNARCRDGLDNDGDGLYDCGGVINGVDRRADTTGGGANPRMAVINPMIRTSTIDGPWSDSTRFTMLRFAEQIRPTYSNTVPPTIIFPGVMGNRPARYSSTEPYDLMLPTMAQNNLPNTAIQINANALCRDAYSIDPNGRFSRQGEEALVVSQSNQTPARLGDIFPYPVTGDETSVVQNEFVMSPTLPVNTFRVVVRWGTIENRAQAQFVGNLYNNTYLATPNEPAYASLSWAMNAPGNLVCNQISQQNFGSTPYWWPTGCQAVKNGTVYIHPFVGPNSSNNIQNTFVQSMTIDGRQPRGTFAFFVDEIDRPIVNFVNTGLTVEVYGAHDNQDSLRSIYLPLQTFSIRGAAGTSSNPRAEYWHVFNLRFDQRTNRYVIQTIGPEGNGSIETGLQEIRNNM